MKVVCCNCQKDIREKEPLDDSSVTHGLCESCLEQSYKEIGLSSNAAVSREYERGYTDGHYAGRFTMLTHTPMLVQMPPSKGKLNPVVELIIKDIEALASREHYYCEDTFYSCPKHPEGGCGGHTGLIDSSSDKCMCGADEKNIRLIKLIAKLKELLS